MNWKTLVVLVPAFLVGCGGVESSGGTAGGMDEIEIPAGEVSLGTAAETSFDAPAKVASVPGFKIDKYEVTNAQYRACVQVKECTEPAFEGFDLIKDYYTNARYDDYPVANVTWLQAAAYCKAQGKRLPTEAEWEMAARGADGRTYPWGETTPSCELAHFGGCGEASGVGGPLAVGSLEKGASPFGVMDMAGNMAEWVSDWYSSEAYDTWQDGEQPVSPTGGRHKSVRGGSWWCKEDRLPTFRREPMTPYYRSGNIGFRCARSL